MNFSHSWKKLFPWQAPSGTSSSQTSFSAQGTIKEINAIFDYPQKWYIYQLDQAVKRLEQARDEFSKHHQNQPEVLFQKMYQSIGTFFKAFHIKKLYNTTPSISLEEYSQLPLFQQAINNVIDKKQTLLANSIHKWGSCVHRPIFFLHFIEMWHIPGLQVKLFTSRLIFKQNAPNTF